MIPTLLSDDVVFHGVSMQMTLVEKMLSYTAPKPECLAEGFYSRHYIQKKDQANQLFA